jgi:hypothetical protein
LKESKKKACNRTGFLFFQKSLEVNKEIELFFSFSVLTESRVWAENTLIKNTEISSKAKLAD